MASCVKDDPWQILRINPTPKKRQLGDQAGTSNASPPLSTDSPVILNCDHGDPTMFEAYWNVHKDDYVMVSGANEALSYFVQSKKRQGGPWFVSAELDDAVRDLHAFVGNAVTRDRVIVVGTGSTQLFQAALFALATRGGTSTPVVSESPFYSGYPQTIEYLQSKLFHWAGDSKSYHLKGDEAIVEVVTSPNNPSGEIREALVEGGKKSNGQVMLVHDLAYYWPTYTPITTALDHDIMLFTLSKSTGHAGLRIGWAIVKDPEVAKKMAEFIVLNTIGVSQDAQFRAAGIIRAVVKGYQRGSTTVEDCMSKSVSLGEKWFFVEGKGEIDATLARSGNLFHWSKAVMESRWGRLRNALTLNKKFSLPEPPLPAICTFMGTASSPSPAFMWLKCEEKADCRMILQRNGIFSRGGANFGVSTQYARLSLVGSDPDMDLLVKRLATLK